MQNSLNNVYVILTKKKKESNSDIDYLNKLK